jgi:quercetin dioxygenase-like cupin family protein
LAYLLVRLAIEEERMGLATIDLRSIELVEAWSKADPSARVNFTFPISGETGAPASSVAYAEIPPGGGIATHSDGANECDVILEGELEFEIDETRTSVGPGVLVQIPADVKHRVSNRSSSPARLVFFFDSARDVVTFDEPLMPMDATVLGRD